MGPCALALIGTLLHAASGGGGGLVATAGATGGTSSDWPSRVTADLVGQAMPPPPTTVVLQTRYFGTVTVDHEAHLARKVACRDCHGPGPVKKIEFTPKLAHDRCRSCHVERQRGPVECRDCHVLPPKGQEALASTAAPADGTSAPVAAAASAAGTSAGAADEVITSSVFTEQSSAHEVVRHSLQFGPVVGPGVGAGIRFSSHQGLMVLTHSVERLAGSESTRTLALVGAGVRKPFLHAAGLNYVAEGILGVDAVETPLVKVMPAVGGRVGLEWAPPRTSRVLFFFSVTALADLFQGGLFSPACAYVTLGVGLPLLSG